MLALVRICLALALLSTTALAQSDAAGGSQQPQPAPRDARLAYAAAPSQAVTFTYANRPITVLRAQVLSYTPQARAEHATAVLDELVEHHMAGPVSTRAVSGVVFLRVGDHDVMNLVAADVDELTGETLEQKATAAAAALRVALAEAIELRTPNLLIRDAARVLGATLLFLIAVVALWRAHPHIHGALTAATERGFRHVLPGQVAAEQTAIVWRFVRGVVTLAHATITALFTYWWLTSSLRQFPYSRPWGELLRVRLLYLLGRIGTNVVDALPGLFMVLVVVAFTRILVRISNALFTSIERGTVQFTWAYPETAGATRRLIAIMLWLFALIVSYPFLPGSGSDAFKGVSVFVGLVVSLGSSGIVNQLMSGLTLTYSRALTIGDAVRIGDHEGMVTALNLLSVKLQTLQGEEITVPNAVVIGQSTTNYTRLAPTGGSYLATSVTIGYDAPWRQVAGLLTLAAERTSNLRRNPPPQVVQEALEDFYVRYRLVVCLENPRDRVATRDRLHANIQDAFNEFGVQIMSPNYVTDPASPKVVPKGRWFDPPGDASTLGRDAA